MLFVVYEMLLICLWAVIFNGVGKLLQRQLAARATARGLKLTVVIGLVALVVTTVAWNIIDSHFDRPIPFEPSQDLKALVAGDNAFALDLYQRLKEQPDNLFFSPYSISTGMGMVHAGAHGDTEHELARTLHFDLPHNNINTAFNELAGRLNNMQHWNHLALLTANSLWYQRGYQFVPAFIDLVRTNYDGEVRPVDFKQAAAIAGQDMATWIGRKTGGRLKGAVDPSLLTPDTRLALCDAIYFKGRWASQFRRSRTQNRPFSISTNQTVNVPMMNQTAAFRLTSSTFYSDKSYMELLELPYYGRDLSLVILLPTCSGRPART